MRTKILSGLFLSSAVIAPDSAAAQNYYGVPLDGNAPSAPWSTITASPDAPDVTTVIVTAHRQKTITGNLRLSPITLSILNSTEIGFKDPANSVRGEFNYALTDRACLSIQSPFMYEDHKTRRGFEIGGTTRFQFKSLLGGNVNDTTTRMSCRENGSHYSIFDDPSIKLKGLDSFTIFIARQNEQDRPAAWGGPRLGH